MITDMKGIMNNKTKTLKECKVMMPPVPKSFVPEFKNCVPSTQTALNHSKNYTGNNTLE